MYWDFNGWACNPVPGPQDAQRRVAIIVTKHRVAIIVTVPGPQDAQHRVAIIVTVPGPQDAQHRVAIIVTVPGPQDAQHRVAIIVTNIFRPLRHR